MTGTEGDRGSAAARGARLVALSVGGGAAITLLGATAASAGDAEATGNESATQGAQTLTVTEDAPPTVGGMTGTVTNLGVAGANTGVNGSEEDDVRSGDATSSGNRAHNDLGQSARSSGTGSGLAVLDQGGHLWNAGAAFADTGFNTGAPVGTGWAHAWGNQSSSSLHQDLDSVGGDGIGVGSQRASIGNAGAAWAETGFNSGDDITSGNATAGGNQSGTSTRQTGTISQESLGAALLQQRSRTRNGGAALANTGFNVTEGDESTNLAQVFDNGELEDESTENDD
jgi:hypothetical protein